MKDIELECLPSWRYCKIPYGTKAPKEFQWHKKPYTLDQIPQTMNIGVILGTNSGGLCALDFDGPAAWVWWDEHIGIDIPTTIAWSSGRQGRCQMAFQVPKSAWDFLKTRKINLETPCPEDTNKMQGFEFRWGDTRGIQSVLPPSLHPETQQPYFWINPPSTTPLAELPDEVMDYWIRLIYPETVVEVEQTTYAKPSNDEVVAIYEELKKYYPKLGYNEWGIATWIITRELGRADGLAVMKHFWPPEKPNDYDILFKSEHQGPVAKLGTIVEWIRKYNPEYKKAKEFNADAPTESSIKRLRKQLKEMY